jgi:gas vesicle protein
MIMKEELNNKGNPILMPFLVGGVVGAGLALLLAPKPGKEVREDIKRFAAISRGKVSFAIDKGKELYDEGRTSVANVIDKGREFYDERRTAVTSAIEAGKTAYNQEKEKWRHAS